ncbi:unnamed protein product [Rhizophagus irregularis]|uniref:HAT C-terminal dimerisation domain-containing protein n=1 Tax=Rhizophagus irregularis TaxID=588596 RepID=A0A915ZRM1_9GLOM|nr:unnamed protein product [Rhizophagus irregularis]
MQYFKICSDYITGQLYPTLAFTIPAYNYLLDKIEDIIDNNNIRIEIKNVATAAKNKIEEYYPITGGHIYIIATDVLAWWKVQEANYPNLSKMALDYLAIPATSAPVERFNEPIIIKD